MIRHTKEFDDIDIQALISNLVLEVVVVVVVVVVAYAIYSFCVNVVVFH
jgi:hypothetical protein